MVVTALGPPEIYATKRGDAVSRYPKARKAFSRPQFGPDCVGQVTGTIGDKAVVSSAAGFFGSNLSETRRMLRLI